MCGSVWQTLERALFGCLDQRQIIFINSTTMIRERTALSLACIQVLNQPNRKHCSVLLSTAFYHVFFSAKWLLLVHTKHLSRHNRDHSFFVAELGHILSHGENPILGQYFLCGWRLVYFDLASPRALWRWLLNNGRRPTFRIYSTACVFTGHEQ